MTQETFIFRNSNPYTACLSNSELLLMTFHHNCDRSLHSTRKKAEKLAFYYKTICATFVIETLRMVHVFCLHILPSNAWISFHLAKVGSIAAPDLDPNEEVRDAKFAVSGCTGCRECKT
jgi:hypothetical protein